MTVGEYTPYELKLIAKQTQRREQTGFENILCLVWRTEALARQKRLPSLKKLLKDARKKLTSKPSKGDAILKAMAAEKGVIIK